MTGSDINNVYALGRAKGKPMLKELLRTFLGETTKAGNTVVDKPVTASHRLWAMAIFAVLVVANRRFGLGLTDQELMELALLVGTYVTFKSIEDAVKRGAAIARHAKLEAPKPGESVPGLDRMGP